MRYLALGEILELNGVVIKADVDEQEQLMLGLAAGTIGRGELVEWLNEHVRFRPSET